MAFTVQLAANSDSVALFLLSFVMIMVTQSVSIDLTELNKIWCAFLELHHQRVE